MATRELLASSIENVALRGFQECLSGALRVKIIGSGTGDFYPIVFNILFFFLGSAKNLPATTSVLIG